MVSLGFILDERRGAVIGSAPACSRMSSSVGCRFFALRKCSSATGPVCWGGSSTGSNFCPGLLVFVATLSHELLLYLLVSRLMGPGCPFSGA